MSRKNIFLLYGTLFIFSLLLRLAVAGFANCGEIKTVRPDTGGYLSPAKSLVGSGRYDSTRRPPGFPVLAAAVFKLGGNENSIEPIHLGDHVLRFQVVGTVILKILTNAVFQFFSFPDINNMTFLVVH